VRSFTAGIKEDAPKMFEWTSTVTSYKHMSRANGFEFSFS
jgi:hypothetical protein